MEMRVRTHDENRNAKPKIISIEYIQSFNGIAMSNIVSQNNLCNCINETDNLIKMYVHGHDEMASSLRGPSIKSTRDHFISRL